MSGVDWRVRFVKPIHHYLACDDGRCDLPLFHSDGHQWPILLIISKKSQKYDQKGCHHHPKYPQPEAYHPYPNRTHPRLAVDMPTKQQLYRLDGYHPENNSPRQLNTGIKGEEPSSEGSTLKYGNCSDCGLENPGDDTSLELSVIGDVGLSDIRTELLDNEAFRSRGGGCSCRPGGEYLLVVLDCGLSSNP